MFKHNLLIILRNFRRFKSSFFINLAGLSTGLACVVLIYLWVNDELQVDRFHRHGAELYQVMEHMQHAHSIETITATPEPLAKALKAEIPEVELAATATDPDWYEKFTVTTGDRALKAVGQFVSEDYFSIFSYPLLQGGWSGKNDVMISASLARKLFSSPGNAIGKPFNWQLGRFKGVAGVAGVFADVPANSSMQFDFAMSANIIRELMPGNMHWSNYNALTYIKLRKGANAALVDRKIAGFVKAKHPGSNITLFLKPYAERYLYGKYENGQLTGGRIAYVRLFSIVAVFILLIACINFMNLSTAKASRRMKEVGIKKALGVTRRALVAQHLGEALLMAFVSLLVALMLVAALMPAFNQLTGKALHLALNARVICGLLAITLVTGLVAGSYPALYLSRFNPLAILKGQLHTSFGELWTRRGLVVFQFTLSIILMVAVMVVYKQIDYVQTRQLGYDRSNVLYFQRDGRLADNLEGFTAGLAQLPGVTGVAGMGEIIVGTHSFTEGLDWPGRKPDEIVKFENVTVGVGAMELLGLQMAEGRTFSKNFPTDSNALILNEAAVKVMGLRDPVGKTLDLWGKPRQVIGVVKDYHFESFHKAVGPLFLKISDRAIGNILVKIAPGKERETVARLEQFYGRYNPGYAFEYRFLDAAYNALYEAENRVSVLSGYFAALAILISCLGLVGLAAFTAERRWKEIGIRKVLGASSTNIVALLSGDFVKLVLAAIVIACPIAWYAMHTWLNGFAYRISLQWWMFAAAALAAVCIALLAVSLQSVKAAVMNPVKSLRSE